MPSVGRLLLLAGAALAVTGVVLLLLERAGGPGKLPGDIRLQRAHVRILIPLGTMIVISLVLTLILSLVAHLWRR